MNSEDRLKATSGVVTVRCGRGFVVDGPRDRLVITASHCLPHLPPAMAACYTEERTYPKLLAALPEKPAVWAECLFADPVADIAVLGPPDNQTFWAEAEAYETLAETSHPFPIKEASEDEAVWLLSLENEWFKADAETRGRGIWLENASEGIMGGMSGSPIISNDGAAIGIVSIGSSFSSIAGEQLTSGGPQARLMHTLPGWLVADE